MRVPNVPRKINRLLLGLSSNPMIGLKILNQDGDKTSEGGIFSFPSHHIRSLGIKSFPLCNSERAARQAAK